MDSGNDFVTKRAGNIQPQLSQELPLPQEPLTTSYTVLQDALIYLGQDHVITYRMLKIRVTNDQVITLLSRFLDLSADQICLLYRYHWTIKLYFADCINSYN